MRRRFTSRIVGDGWVIQRPLGRGATSTVFLAHPLDDDETWRALKEIRLETLSSHEAAETAALFGREVAIMAALAHPAFPLLVDSFRTDDALYLVMEYVKGRTLERIVAKNGPCPDAWILPLACDVADALHALHTHPLGTIVFRDVKPGNVMVTHAGEVKLVDFGIARVHDPRATHDTQPLGTPGFAAPEQYGLAQTTPRSDIYSLGATIFFALSGRDPGPATDQPPSVRDHAPQCSEALDRILRRCLHLDPAQRWESAGALLAALESVPVPPLPLTSAPRRRRGSLLQRWLRNVL